MKRFTILILLISLTVFSQFIVWTPAAQAVPASCQEAPNDPNCIMDLMFEWAFSEWNVENEGRGIHGVGMF